MAFDGACIDRIFAIYAALLGWGRAYGFVGSFGGGRSVLPDRRTRVLHLRLFETG